MVSFLKTCLKGFLTIILSPLWIAFFAVSFVISIILFFYTMIKCFLELITRRSHGIYDTEYDKRAKEILSNPNFNPVTGNAQIPYVPPVVPVAPVYQQPQPMYPPQQNPNYPPYPPYPPQNSMPPYQQPPYPPYNPNDPNNGGQN